MNDYSKYKLIFMLNKIIDYLGGLNHIGIIDKISISKYIPKLNNETNTKEILNAKIQ